jgi:hypothetical protein
MSEVCCCRMRHVRCLDAILTRFVVCVRGGGLRIPCVCIYMCTWMKCRLSTGNRFVHRPVTRRLVFGADQVEPHGASAIEQQQCVEVHSQMETDTAVRARVRAVLTSDVYISGYTPTAEAHDNQSLRYPVACLCNDAYII